MKFPIFREIYADEFWEVLAYSPYLEDEEEPSSLLLLRKETFDPVAKVPLSRALALLARSGPISVFSNPALLLVSGFFAGSSSLSVSSLSVLLSVSSSSSSFSAATVSVLDFSFIGEDVVEFERFPTNKKQTNI